MILEAITQQTCSDWTFAAAVCKEWQHFIEKRRFHRLKLKVPGLDNLERLGIRQRSLVRYISLDIELPTYTCRSCKRTESESWIQRNRKPATGLTLELNAFSPSDSDHWFKSYHFVSDPEGGQGNACEWHDERHGWIDGQQVEIPPPSAILRLFEVILLHFPKELPRVNAVTCFIIRRQLRRWFLPQSFSLILEKLCCLEQLIYEPWRAWDGDWAELRDRRKSHDIISPPAPSTTKIWALDFSRLVQERLPKTLKSIVVFEDFSRNLGAVLHNAQGLLGQRVNLSRMLDAQVGTAFARRSLDLQHLSVSYMVDAMHFFQGCMPDLLGRHSDRETWTWQHLQSLALTSQCLQRTGNRREIDALLGRAATVVLRMPKLHTLVLWNDTNACAFIYACDSARGARITWRGTWELDMTPYVVQMWQSVAWKVHSCALQVVKEGVDGVIRSHGDAIHHLGLPCQVVTPASLWQIRQEGNPHTE